MKHLATLLFVFSLFFGFQTQVHAQSSCSSIDANNKDICCSSYLYAQNKNACDAFIKYGYTQQTTTVQTQVSTQCSTIDNFNYYSCCQTFYRNQNLDRCVAKETIAGTQGGGTGATVNTGAINGATSGGAYNSAAGSSQSSAASLNQCSDIKFSSLLDILIWVKCIIVVAIIPLIFALALVFFLWGVMKFIMASDSTKKEEGKKFIVAGLIGLFVMTSLWGIVNIVSKTLGTGSVVPMLQTSALKKTP